jgi:hypothetical protein
MASLLSGSLAAVIHKATKGLFLNATLTRDVAGTPSPDTEDFDPVAPTEVEYDCKAIHESYAERYRLDGPVKQSDRKVLILAQSLAVTPIEGDLITIRSETFTIIEISSDPALACWECKARV